MWYMLFVPPTVVTINIIVTECIVCVPGHDPFIFSFLLSFSFWWGGSFMAPIIWSVKTCVLGPPRPLSPSVPAVAGRQLVIVWAAAYASDSGESLHCFLVGANKSYVIAASDLWLHSCFQPASLTPHQNLALASRIGSRRVTHWPGDSVEELSGGTETV